MKMFNFQESEFVCWKRGCIIYSLFSIGYAEQINIIPSGMDGVDVCLPCHNEKVAAEG
jgi:hypothetical protein